ncbi:MAG: hypothetical protein IT350_02745 [Deltaproteobacteria bacterium]|nr:hypothetical protein [Deltaproteobacteria bacterium]
MTFRSALLAFVSALLVILAVLMTNGLAFAQDDGGANPYDDGLDDERETHFGGGLLQVGGVFFDFDRINSTLKKWGYPEFDGNFTTVGFESFYRRGNLRSDFMVPIFIRESDSSTRFESAMMGGAIIGHVGFNMVPPTVFNCYPMIGIGYGWLQMSHTEKGGNSVEVAHTSTRRVLNMTAHNFILDAGAVLDVTIPTFDRKGRQEHFVISARGGYMWTPPAADWRSGAFNVSGGPEFHMTGPYVLVGIGGDRETYD